GVLTGGHPLAGADGYFGEYGHLPLFPRGRQCRCGARGCWETEVGTHSLLRQAGHAPDEGPVAVLERLTAAANGHRPARIAVHHTADRIAIGLAAIVNTLNPRLIILGGFFADLWPLAEPRIRRALCRHALAAPTERLTIVPALLGEDATLLGAAETALTPVLQDPAALPPLPPPPQAPAVVPPS